MLDSKMFGEVRIISTKGLGNPCFLKTLSFDKIFPTDSSTQMTQRVTFGFLWGKPPQLRFGPSPKKGGSGELHETENADRESLPYFLQRHGRCRSSAVIAV